jgi:hypothetical protein
MKIVKNVKAVIRTPFMKGKTIGKIGAKNGVPGRKNRQKIWPDQDLEGNS